MKVTHAFPCAALLIGLAWAVESTSAKPPASPAKDNTQKPSAAPSPAPTPDPGANALARWLARVPAENEAIPLPLAEVVAAAAGKKVNAFDPADLFDAAALTRIGGALDGILPRMNRLDSAAHASTALGIDAVADRFTDELRVALQIPPPADHDGPGRSYPALKWKETGTGGIYYLPLPPLKPGDPKATVCTGAPPDVTLRVDADGCFLLVGIEYDTRPDRSLAFLNWQVVDLAKVKVRFVPSFQARGLEVFRPSSVLTDGRKGRD